MNCRSFETIIAELARGQMLEARLKESALAHMEECRRCAARFADEQALTAGLRSVATQAALMEAPAHVEDAVLSAFRLRATNSSAPVGEVPQAKTLGWRVWAIAAAAAILVAATFSVARLLLTPDQPAQEEASTTQPTTLPHSTGTGAEIPPTTRKTEPTPIPENPEQEFAVHSSSSPINKRRGFSANSRWNAGQPQPASNELANEEIATDFLPLTYAGSLSQMDGGQVVRVELPRSALQSFGLPVNAELASTRVKADVLLGYDGVARAIRFVR